MFPIAIPVSLIIYLAIGMAVATPLTMWVTRLSPALAGWRWRGWTTLACGLGWGGLLATGLIAWLRLLLHTGDYLPIRSLTSPTDWLLLVCVAPLVEEAFFRGAILGNLQRRWSPFWAVFLSAMFYTTVHSTEPWIAITFGVSIGYALAFLQAGSVAAPMLAHAIAVAALFGARAAPDFVLSLPPTLLPIVAAACVVLLLIAGWAQRGRT